MNKLIIRTTALIIHALLNIFIISWLTDFDITGKWIYFIGFVLIAGILLLFFIRHIFSFIQFIKST